MKVCFITSIYGNYELSCKPFSPQTIETDFICFTNQSEIINNGWIIDTTPYHTLYPSPLDNGEQRNSMKNNQHFFNIAKYYKIAFRNIPRLSKYDCIIWIDGSIEIINPRTSEWVASRIIEKKIIGWEHEYRKGLLLNEIVGSYDSDKYATTEWNGQTQPYQDVFRQYVYYRRQKYNEYFFKNKYPYKENMGVWVTCFVAFSNKDEMVKQFLDEWYLQILNHTTQDQIGFPFACQKINIVPYTLPDAEIKGERPHFETEFYIKQPHGV
jgi:hypothetical protein